MTSVLVLLGSLRADSLNRRLADLAAEAAPAGTTLTCYEGLDELPLYNEDLDTADAPPAVAALRAAAAAADAVLIVTPEYNGTIPAVLKNAIDWLSRPYGASAWQGTPLAVIGIAQGRHGGLWAHDETRKSAGIAGARVLDEVALSVPAASLGGRHPREQADLVAAVAAAVGELSGAAGAGRAVGDR